MIKGRSVDWDLDISLLYSWRLVGKVAMVSSRSDSWEPAMLSWETRGSYR